MVKSIFVPSHKTYNMAAVGSDIKNAKALLDENKLVAIPTETVYGLAGNATNIECVSHIFKVKERPTFDPLIVHTYSLEQLKNFVVNVPVKAEQLAKRFWPGPLTLLLEKREIIPDLVTAGLQTVAVRIPNHAMTLSLLRTLEYPLAAPSANPFGYISPTSALHVNQQLGGKIDYILDGGDCSVGVESTIVGFEGEKVVIHRLGGISIEKIESIVGKVEIKEQSSSNPTAPGMLESHYAPKKEIIIGDIEELIKEHDNCGVLSFKRHFDDVTPQIQLSKTGDLDEAAQRLFGALRELDNKEISLILTELVPDHGLGRAINDRLKRAAAKR